MIKRILVIMLLMTVTISGCISSNENIDDERISLSLNGMDSFSEYSEIDMEIDPASEPYDFSDADLDLYVFSDEQKAMLMQYGFVISPSGSDLLFHEYYDQLNDMGVPIFVTSDSILHSFHILYDYSLRIAEMHRFNEDLMDITAAILERSEEIYSSSDGNLKESAKFNVAFFSVAMSLLDPDFTAPEYVKDMVDSELGLINATDGIYYSPLFGYREDYSQYEPRGHYTRNETLERYFRAMMWYGRMTYRLKDVEQTRSAVLLVMTVQGLQTEDGSDAMDLWDDIYLTTSFFVGDADDLLIYDYAQVMVEVYGDTVALEDVNDDDLFQQFMEKAKGLPDPRINSSVITDQDDMEDETKGLRFMGQRFIVDSYMFFELVYNNVLTYYGDDEPFTLVYSDAGPIRGFPRGLDIFSVLGFDNASEILEEEGDTDYVNYDSQIEMLKDEIGEYTIEDWTKNLYISWLYTLESLSDEAEDGWPSFMQSDMWELKELNTALGSWAELRHDTILYAKQSYTFEATSMPPQYSSLGYVEPQPYMYSRLLALTRMARDGLAERDLLTSELEQKYDGLDSLLVSLIEISEKEISSESLTENEFELINDIGTYLESITTFSAEVSNELESEADSSIALVADVHTDVNSYMVLEEAVGYPYTIYVIVEIDGEVLVVQGPVFSYYEFKQPLDNRLTDEEWQEMLNEGSNPGIPGWTSEIIKE
ncbi:MAG TPA: DUF3160 domain-containing protein [Candidatus Methanofastidiosa archaeon]|nr:DUF3160 domain-containing protein [Candidatus Methanofastidiosa archaeon]